MKNDFLSHEKLKLYRLIPVARAGDPSWQNSDHQGEIVVRAFSPADARVTAAQAELDVAKIDAPALEGNAPQNASPFRNERLYAVVEMLDRNGIADDGPRGVLPGAVAGAMNKPILTR